MSDFNWDEIPEAQTAPKKAKREEIDVPAPIVAMAQKALDNGERTWQPLPTVELANQFLTFIRGAGDKTNPLSSVIAKIAEKDKDGKELKDGGKTVVYTVGERRGRKPGEEGQAEGSEEGQEGAEEGQEGSEEDGSAMQGPAEPDVPEGQNREVRNGAARNSGKTGNK